jgi:hypothetical protein
MTTTERKRPHGAQEYKGNGNHEWEAVAEGTERLRVPGGWIYSVTYEGDVASTSVFVPVPNVVGYAV